MGLSALPTDHPLNVGMLGMHGNYGPNVMTNECDVLVAVGMRFDDRVTGNLEKYAKQAKVIHIELDPAEINKNVFAHIPVLGDAKEALNSLLPLVETRSHDSGTSDLKTATSSSEKRSLMRSCIQRPSN